MHYSIFNYPSLSQLLRSKSMLLDPFCSEVFGLKRNFILYIYLAKPKGGAGGNAGKSFLKPFFLIRENFFQSFRTKFSPSFCVISLA